MPIKQAAKKHLRQTKKLTEHNRSVKTTLRSAMKQARKLIEAKDTAKATEAVKKATKLIDKAAQNKIIKKNTASRYKSRLTSQLNKLG